ncbi:MAG: glycosyltransferase [Patescibacteria group bacterium]
MNKKKIILAIPVFNGKKYIEETLQELENFKLTFDFDLKVIFCDDGSFDGTPEKFNEEKNKKYNLNWNFLSYQKNCGKGFALKKVFENIKNEEFDFFAFTDIELPYGLDFLNQSTNFENYNFIFGNRKINKARQYKFYRKIMSKIFRLFLPTELKKYTDTQCGLKIFDKNSAEIIFSKIKTGRWVFDLEIFLLAEKNNFKKKELPVIIKEKCLINRGGVSFFKHGFFILKDLLVIHFYNKKKKYE